MPPKAKAKPGAKRREFSPGVQNGTRSRGSSSKPASGSPRGELASSLRSALRCLDTDKTGLILQDDLKHLLLELEEGLTAVEVERILKKAVKSNRHGEIDYEEFIDCIVNSGHGMKAPPAESAKAKPAESELPVAATGHVAHVLPSVGRMAQKEKLDILDAASVEQISVDELLEIQKLHRPPETVKRILECTCMILWARESPKPRASPDWIKMREFIADDSFIPAVLEFDLKDLARAPALTRLLHERFFGKNPLTYERVLYANTAAAALFKWCSAVILKAKTEIELEPTPSEPEPKVEEPPLAPEPVVEELPLEPESVVEEIPLEPEPVVEELPPEPEPVLEELQPEPEPVVEKLPPDPEPVVEEAPPAPLPLSEVELSHLSFRRDAGLCPDGWPKDSDCVVCFIWAHLEFRRDAEVCPDGHEEDWQCETCRMFPSLKRFMFGGDMPAAPGLPVGPRHKEVAPARQR